MSVKKEKKKKENTKSRGKFCFSLLFCFVIKLSTLLCTASRIDYAQCSVLERESKGWSSLKSQHWKVLPTVEQSRGWEKLGVVVVTFPLRWWNVAFLGKCGTTTTSRAEQRRMNWSWRIFSIFFFCKSLGGWSICGIFCPPTWSCSDLVFQRIGGCESFDWQTTWKQNKNGVKW